MIQPVYKPDVLQSWVCASLIRFLSVVSEKYSWYREISLVLTEYLQLCLIHTHVIQTFAILNKIFRSLEKSPNKKSL